MVKKPEGRTLDYLIATGWMPTLVSGRSTKYLQHDAWKCFDIAAKQLGRPGTLWIQATDHSNHAARRKKLLRQQKVVNLCVATGDQCEIWSWHPTKSEPRREVLGYAETWPKQAGKKLAERTNGAHG